MNLLGISSLFLASVPMGVFIGVLVGAIVVIGALGFFFGRFLYKRLFSKKVGDAEQQIKIMREEAETNAAH